MQLKKIYIVAMISGCFVFSADAQQIVNVSQFTQHNFIYNPAAAGAEDNPSIGAVYKKMWSGISGGPQTVVVYGDKYFSKKNTGVGVYFYDDKTGPTSRTGGQLNLSYSVELGSKAKRVMFGLAAEVLQYKINKAAMLNYIPNDPLLAGADSKLKGDAAAGVYYKSPTLNVGFSVQHILQSKLNFIKEKNNPEGKLYRHCFIIGSYNFRVDEDNVLVPNLMVKFLPNTSVPVDVQVGARIEHKDMLWLGANYIFRQEYSLFAGLKINQRFAVGYAFDQYNSPLNVFDNGSSGNELFLRYYFK